MVGSCRFKSIWMLTLIHSVYFTLALDPPSNLRVAELGSDFVTVAWTAPVSGADSFDATISPTDDGESSTPQFFNTSYATWRSLTPGKTYMVEVTSIKSGETPSFPTILTLTTLPASPFNIKVSKFINPIMNQFRVTGSRTIMYPVYGAVVSWDQPEFGKFDDFLLSIDPSHGKIRVPIKLKSGLPAQELTEQKRIVWDLLPGILYEFTVQSKSNGMLSNPLTGQERMPPEIPGSISVDKVDSTSVDISWGGEHRGMLDGYVIETDPDGGVAEQVHGDPLHQKRRVTNLTPGTKYKVELYSTMAGLLSFKPSVVEFKTPPAVPLNKVRSEEVRAESVFITWNPPPGKMDYYEVVYFPTDRDFGRLRQRVWEPRVNMTTLDPGSSYQVEIHAISNDLTSKPLIETVYTKPLPPNKVITTATQSTIVLSWETVYYDGSGKIEYYPEQNETESITRYLEPGMTELTITKLDPGTNYVVRVSTIKSGVESDAITMITRTATIAKTPPSDNIPVPREPATEETIVRTTITSETTQGIAALVQETTAAETETFETTAATTRESEATTSKRTTIKQSTTTPTEPSTEPTTKTSIATTTTTTTAPTTPTSTIQRIETTKEQRIPSSSTITEGTVRATETTTTSTAATIATSATTPTSKPVEFTEAKQTVTTSTHGQTTKEYTTTKFESRSTTDEHTTQASTSRPSTVTEAATQPTSTTASTVELTTAESTTQSRTTDEATSPATIATTKLAETTTDISAETETIFIPPPFPFEENPGPPEKLEEGPTEYTTEATIDEITAAVDIETYNHNDVKKDNIPNLSEKSKNPTTDKDHGKELPLSELDRIVTFEKFTEIDDKPVVKAGEIYFPNTVAISSTLAPHFSLPNEVVGKTIKPFPTTPYYPWRTTTDPVVFPTFPQWFRTPYPSPTKPLFPLTKTPSTTTLYTLPSVFTTRPTTTSAHSETKPSNWKLIKNPYQTVTVTVQPTTGYKPVLTQKPIYTWPWHTKELVSTTREPYVWPYTLPTSTTRRYARSTGSPLTWRTTGNAIRWTTASQTDSTLNWHSTEGEPYVTTSPTNTYTWKTTKLTGHTTTTSTEAPEIRQWKPTSYPKPTVTATTRNFWWLTKPNILTKKHAVSSSTQTQFPEIFRTTSPGTTSYKTTAYPTIRPKTLNPNQQETSDSKTFTTYSETVGSKSSLTTPYSDLFTHLSSWLIPVKSTTTKTLPPILRTTTSQTLESRTISANKATIRSKPIVTSSPSDLFTHMSSWLLPTSSTTSRTTVTSSPSDLFTHMSSWLLPTTSTIPRSTVTSPTSDSFTHMSSWLLPTSSTFQNTPGPTTLTPGEYLSRTLANWNVATTKNKTPSANIDTASNLHLGETTPSSNTNEPSISFIFRPEGRGYEITQKPKPIRKKASTPINRVAYTTPQSSKEATVSMKEIVRPEGRGYEITQRPKPLRKTTMKTSSTVSKNLDTTSKTGDITSENEVTTVNISERIIPTATLGSNKVLPTVKENEVDGTIYTTNSIVVSTDTSTQNMATSSQSGVTITTMATSKGPDHIGFTNALSQMSTIAKQTTTQSVSNKDLVTNAYDQDTSTITPPAGLNNTIKTKSLLLVKGSTTTKAASASSVSLSTSTKPAIADNLYDEDKTTIRPDLPFLRSQTDSESTTTFSSKHHVTKQTSNATTTSLPQRGTLTATTASPQNHTRHSTSNTENDDLTTLPYSNSNVTQSIDSTDSVTQEDIIITEDQETITIRNGFKTICDPNNITVLVDKNVIGKYEEQFGPLHFNADDGQDCRGVEYEKYYRYTVAPNILGCGTQFEVNDTHVNFTNTVSNRLHHEKWYEGLLDPSKSILIGRKGMKPFPLVHMNFYCTFPLEMTVHTDLIPDLRVEVMTFNVSGVGQFSAMMQLFKDDEYRHPYFAAPSLRQDQILRAGITLLKNKDEDISIAVRKCWATPVSDVDYDTYYPLIDDYCPLEDALKGNLTILENGKSKRSRWEGPVFKFVRFPEVWLHCELKVCFGDSCNTTCDGSDASRSRRAAGMHGRGPTVSAGPIHASREKIVKPVSQKPPAEPEKTSGLEETTVIIIVTVLSAAIILMCILFALIIIKCRRRDKDRKPIAHPESIASSTLSSRGRDNWEETGQYHVKKSPKHTPAVDPVLPPVPTVLGTGNFPERFDVIEEVSAPASGYGNPAFESTENNMR